MQQEGTPTTPTGALTQEPVAQESLTALPTVVGFGVGIALFLVAAIGSWRHRVRKLRSFHAVAAEPCRPGRWPAGSTARRALEGDDRGDPAPVVPERLARSPRGPIRVV